MSITKLPATNVTAAAVVVVVLLLALVAGGEARARRTPLPPTTTTTKTLTDCDSQLKQMERNIKEKDHVDIIEQLHALKKDGVSSSSSSSSSSSRCAEVADLGQSWLQRKLVKEVHDYKPSLFKLLEYTYWLYDNDAIDLVNVQLLGQAQSLIEKLQKVMVTRTISTGPYDRRTPVFFFLGYPGSGKSTSTKALAKEGIPNLGRCNVVSVGELSRQSNSRLAVKHQVDGLPEDAKQTVKMLEKTLSKRDNCVILDGFPRTLLQLTEWEDELSDDFRIVNVINLNVSRSTSRARVRTRSATPSQQRNDDHVVDERMSVYDTQTALVIDLFKARGLVTDIDANRPFETVLQDVKQVMEELSSELYAGEF